MKAGTECVNPRETHKRSMQVPHKLVAARCLVAVQLLLSVTGKQGTFPSRPPWTGHVTPTRMHPN